MFEYLRKHQGGLERINIKIKPVNVELELKSIAHSGSDFDI